METERIIALKGRNNCERGCLWEFGASTVAQLHEGRGDGAEKRDQSPLLRRAGICCEIAVI